MTRTFYKFFLISFFCLTLSGVVDSRLFAANTIDPKSQGIAQNVSPQYSFNDYKKECLQRSTREGLPREDAEKLCNCAIAKFRDRYTIQQFRALVQKSKTSKVAAQTLSNVGESCFEEILYE